MIVTKMNNQCSVRRLWPCLLALYLLVLAGCASTERTYSTARAGTALAHGMLAFNHGEDQEAAALFEEAVHFDPREGTAWHWLGLTYLELGRTSEAVERLEASLKAKRPPMAGRERVLADLQAAREALKAQTPPRAFIEPGYGPVVLSFGDLPRWEGRVGLASAYDSNPALLAEGLPFPVEGIAAVAEVPADLIAALDLRAEAHPFYDRRGWSLGVSFAGNQSLHQDLDDLDLSFARGLASLAWGRSSGGIVTGPLGYTRVPPGGTRATVLLQGGGSFLWLDGEAFVRHAEGALSVAVPEPGLGETRVDLKALDREFPDEDGPAAFHLSGSELSLGLGQVFALGRGGRYLRLNEILGENHAGRVFESSFDETSAELSAPLADRWTLFLLGSRRRDRFAHPESNVTDPTGPLRDDLTWRGTASVVWQVDRHLSWTVRGSHIRRDSNVDLSTGSPLFDYRRTIFSFGFNWIF